MPDKKAPCAVEKYLLWHASPANKTNGTSSSSSFVESVFG